MENIERAERVEVLDGDEEIAPEVKAYKRRWVILTIFIIYAAINAFQWIEYSSVTHLVVKYYNVSTLAVNWTTIVYMALYPVLVIPASYIIDKKGLRVAGLIGCIGTGLATGIKVFSIRQDLFPVVLAGQAIAAASQVVILCLPTKIASIWFKPNEVSTACSLGVFGSQMGSAIGYILPPILVQDSNDLEDIGKGFKILSRSLASVMLPVALAVIFYFPNQPPLPPSGAQAALRNRQKFKTKTFFKSIKKLFLNRGFVIHMVAYGINIAVFSAVSTLLNQFVLQYFEDIDEDVGRMGFVMVVTGMIGSVAFGVLLDKTHKYKEVTFLIYLFSAVSVLFLMYSLELRLLWMTYLACATLGLFTNSYMPVGFELAMELTFPSEESTTTGILMAMTQVLGVGFTVAAGYINLWMGSFWALASQGILLLIGTIITGFIPKRLLRQEAFKQNNNNFKRKA